MTSSQADAAARHARIKALFLEALDQPESSRLDWLAERCSAEPELRREVEMLLEHLHSDEALDRTVFEPRRDARPDLSLAMPGSDEPGTAGLGPDAPRSGSQSVRPPLESGRNGMRGGGSARAVGERRRATASPASGSGRRSTDEPPLAGRYRLLELIGEGGMAEVFRAWDELLDQPVALKRIHLPARAEEVALNEVRLARQVTHPNVCRVFDVGEVDGVFFLTMEYVEGEDLGALLRKIGRLPQDKAVEVARQLCAGLAAAHARGILHRDLKPANVLIDRDGRVKITDFGIASAEAATDRQRAGTPAYMAPEIRGGGVATVKSDVYALGLVVQQLFSGQGPIDPLDDRTPPTAPILGRQIEAALAAATERDPTHRTRSVLAFASALPGCDVLAMADEAGITPSPEIVIAAESGLGQSTVGAVWSWALALVGLSLLFLILASDRTERPPPRAPDYLAGRAADGVERLGLSAARWRAWGFLGQVEVTPSLIFWYRQSPQPLAPWDVDNVLAGTAEVEWSDPPFATPGMIRVIMDGEGRFLELDRLPEPGEKVLSESGGEGMQAVASPWGEALRLTGVGGELTSVAPRELPLAFADARAAFTGQDPRSPGNRVRVEVAALGGKLVFLRVLPLHDAGALASTPEVQDEGTGLAAGAIRVASQARDDLYIALSDLTMLLLLVALPFAYAALRSGRADVVGTTRLLVGVAAARLVSWGLVAAHVPVFRDEVLLVVAGVASVLLECVGLAAAYLALEPFLRRHRPRTLIAWSRALAGRLDPSVGRAILVGSVAGVFLASLGALEHRFAVDVLGFSDPMEAGRLWAAVQGRHLLALFCGQWVEGVYSAIAALLLLVSALLLLRRTWVAVLAFVVLASAYYGLEGIHPMSSWVILGLGISATAAFLLLRYGLLALAVAFAVELTLFSVPVALDPGLWYAPVGFAGLLSALAVGGFGVILMTRGGAARRRRRRTSSRSRWDSASPDL